MIMHGDDIKTISDYIEKHFTPETPKQQIYFLIMPRFRLSPTKASNFASGYKFKSEKLNDI